MYLATVATNGVGEAVVGGDVGTGAGSFVGEAVVGGDVGKGVGSFVGGDVGSGVPAVGGGVGDGPFPMHPLVVSNTAVILGWRNCCWYHAPSPKRMLIVEREVKKIP